MNKYVCENAQHDLCTSHTKNVYTSHSDLKQQLIDSLVRNSERSSIEDTQNRSASARPRNSQPSGRSNSKSHPHSIAAQRKPHLGKTQTRLLTDQILEEAPEI